jgi:predicted dehydrogenase
VLVAAPLAASSLQAADLLRVAAEQQRTLRCAQPAIATAAARRVQALIASRELGELSFATSSRVRLDVGEREVSVMQELAPDEFARLRSWLGERPATISATGRAAIVPDLVDLAFVTLTFAGGVTANLELSWHAPRSLCRTVLVGSERMVVVEEDRPDAVRVFDHGIVYQDPESFDQHHLSFRTGDITTPALDARAACAVELDDFVMALDGRATAADRTDVAVDVVRMLEAADRSLAEAGAPVLVDDLSLVRPER